MDDLYRSAIFGEGLDWEGISPIVAKRARMRRSRCVSGLRRDARCKGESVIVSKFDQALQGYGSLAQLQTPGAGASLAGKWC